MTLLEALILGLIEGITEYLPVSSTGHLLIAQRLLGIPDDAAANAFAIAIQAGAIVAVLGIYRARATQMVLGVFGKDSDGLKLVGCLLAAFVPAAIIGGLFDDKIEQVLFGVKPILIAWVVGGLVILALAKWIERRREGRGLLDLRWQQAVLIGLIQCVAMWPGTSRSLVTILGGLLVGLSMAAAVEFAFLLGVVTLGAATAYTALKHGDVLLASYGPAVLFAGFAMAWLSAALAVKWMVAWLNKHGLTLFAWWRFAAAAMAAALLL
ncbi:MAG: undecaprenyl-diphosphate phosphatase [Steroidobacteraceae bacterium]